LRIQVDHTTDQKLSNIKLQDLESVPKLEKQDTGISTVKKKDQDDEKGGLMDFSFD
jgi:hypothetical protein